MEWDKPPKRATVSMYKKLAEQGGYVTNSIDWKSRFEARQAWEKEQVEEQPKETEEEACLRQMESDLARRERQQKLEAQKKQKQKAKEFSKEMNKSLWKPKAAISVLDTKKNR